MKITRADVLRAMISEPLCSGRFVSSTGCRGCAIGNVLRRKLGTAARDCNGFHITGAGFAAGNAQMLAEALVKGEWASAISIKFEQLAKARATKLKRQSCDLSSKQLSPVRAPMRAWIKKNIPAGVIYDDHK